MERSWKALFSLMGSCLALLPSYTWAQPVTGHNDRRHSTGGGTTSSSNASEAQLRRRAGPAGPTDGDWRLDPVGPQIDPGIYAPVDFQITSNTTTEVGLSWLHLDGPKTTLSRSINNGPWTVIKSYGALPGGARVDYHDQGSLVSAENCYRVTVSDGVNSFSAKPSPVRCAITPDGSMVKVYWAELRLTMGNLSGAGTDDPVQIRLQSPIYHVDSEPSWVPAGNGTWLDSFADDFERGSDRTYELLTDHVTQLSDITMLTIAKEGADTMCVRGVELHINGHPSFAKTFGSGPNGCASVGPNGVLSIPFDELRAQASWAQTQLPSGAPGLTANHLKALITAQFGDKLHGRGSLQNGGVLTTTFKDKKRLAVRIPIVVHNVPILGNVSSTVFFDLVFDTLGSHLSVQNVNADSSDLLELLSPVIVSKILWETSQTIESTLGQISPINVANPASLPTACFTPEGGITYGYENTCGGHF